MHHEPTHAACGPSSFLPRRLKASDPTTARSGFEEVAKRLHEADAAPKAARRRAFALSEERHFQNGIAADEDHHRKHRLQYPGDDEHDEAPREPRFDNPRWQGIEAALTDEIARNEAKAAAQARAKAQGVASAVAKRHARSDFTPLHNLFMGPEDP